MAQQTTPQETPTTRPTARPRPFTHHEVCDFCLALVAIDAAYPDEAWDAHELSCDPTAAALLD